MASDAPTLDGRGLVGRNRERTAISAALQMGSDKQAGLVLAGDAGMGKTALSRHAIRQATDAGFRVLHASGGEVERDLPHTALADLFVHEYDRLEGTLPVPLAHVVAGILGRHEDPSLLEPRSLALATLGFLDLLGSDQSLAIVLDDLHWVDAASARALSFALRRVAAPRLVVIATQRRSRRLPMPLRAVWPDRRVVQLDIGPLAPHEIVELLGDRVNRPLPVAVLHRITELCAGNPLLALELGQLVTDDDLLPDDLDFARLPDRAAQIIRRRISKLPRGQAQVAATVAAMSRRTDAAMGAAGIATRDLRAIRDAGLLREEDGSWEFTHPLVRSAAMAQLTAQERRHLHARLAQLAAEPVDRAGHVARSVVGPDEPAAAIVEEGAREAQRLGAPLEGSVLAERAVELTETTSGPERFRRLVLAGALRRGAGDLPTARRHLLAAVEQAPRNEKSEALFELARVEAQTGDPRAMSRLRAALRGASSSTLRAEIRIELADHLRLSKGPSVARRHARLALHDAESSGDVELLARCLGATGVLAFNRSGRLDEALIARALKLEASLGPLGAPGRPQGAVVDVVHMLAWWGAFERARSLLDALAPGETTWPFLPLDATWFLAVVDLWEGQWDAANDRLAALERVAEIRHETTTAILTLRTLLAAHRGDANLPQLARRAQRAAQPERLDGYLASVHGAVGLWWLGRDNAAAALPSLERSVAIQLERGPLVPGVTLVFPDAIEALAQAGRVADARALAAKTRSRTRGWKARMFRAGMARALAVLSLAEGDLRGAAERLEPWVGGEELRDLPFLHARAELAWGLVLRKQRQRSLAQAALERAGEGFRAVGSLTWADRADRELRRVGSRPGGAGRSLTATEEGIAGMAAQGRTNREIAAGLFLSEKTVEWNLTRIYEKVGVRSRAELAARFRRDRPAEVRRGASRR